MGTRRGLITAVAALGLCLPLLQTTGCAEDDCAVDADCPAGRLCRLGLCVLNPNGPTDVPGGEVDASVDVPPLTCAPAGPNDLVLTEILADPGGKDPDGNGDPNNTADEFVEFVNVGSSAVALTNVTIVTKAEFALPAICLEPNAAFVLWGTQLTNGGGIVQLFAQGIEADSHEYGSEGGKAQSLTRADQLDKASDWVLHSSIATTDFSPGFCPNGNPFPNCTGIPVVEDGTDGGEVSGEVSGEVGDGETIPSCSGEAPLVADLVINEILADPGDIDTNGDGVTSSSTGDEFLEIVSLASADLDLGGVTVEDKAGGTYEIPAGTCLAPSQVLLLINNYDGTTSTATFPDAVVLSMGNAFQLNNTSETVIVKDSAGGELINIVYGGEANGDEAINLEIELDPTSGFTKHSAISDANGALSSPGTCRTGQAFPNCAVEVEPGPEVGDTDGGDVPVGDTEDDGAGPDVDPDAIVDVPDTAGELPLDVPQDMTPDTPIDTPVDGPTDVPTDVTPDTPTDTPMDIPVDTPDAAACTAAAPTAGQLVISEVMANPNDGAGGFDFNNDGVYSGTADEYVEIINMSGGPLNIDGVLLQVDTPTLNTKLTIATTVCLPAQGAILVFGGGTPNLAVGAEVMVFAASGLALNNPGDTVAVVAADGLTQLDMFTYASSTAAVSWAADPEGSTNFVLHGEATTSAGATASPGTCSDGSPFTTCLPIN